MKKLFLLLILLLVIIQASRWIQTVMIGEVGYVTTLISDQRRYCALYFSNVFCPFFYNKVLFYPTFFIKNYLTAISINYLFLQRPLYVMELPLFLLGGWFLIQKKNWWRKYLLYYFLIYPFLGPLFSLDWQINYLLIKPALLIVEIFGLWEIGKILLKLIRYEKS